jgi:hypothetical protein
MSFLATTGDIAGEDVRDLTVTAVRRRDGGCGEALTRPVAII